MQYQNDPSPQFDLNDWLKIIQFAEELNKERLILKLSDRELESALRENLYMEFSVGKRRRKKIATSNDADAQAAKRKKKKMVRVAYSSFEVHLAIGQSSILPYSLRWKWRYVRREECFSLLANVS